MIALAVASTCVVGIGLFEMPYSFYSLLRVVLCLSSAVGFAAALRGENGTWMWIYGVMAVLYNPVFPVRLGDKNLWIGINAATLVCIWLGAARFRGAMSETKGVL